MRQQCKQLTFKINEIKMDADEHDLVIKALEPLDPARTCFRMVDAIVVERSVADVLPAVRKNLVQVSRIPANPHPRHDAYHGRKTRHEGFGLYEYDADMHAIALARPHNNMPQTHLSAQKPVPKA